ncbi:hypothetical protein CY34DRAFT_472059 [Suillus luteus UH-Slu-Lm8-n1]|uniref:Uncharacterized protein n=1 Tax=Suillus luteus UH-Slu-Lm8-n1 TaxID=930992 RepID=A0A0D0A779_9AGAM|nr:hypothetical protein CY34DRAFT_472059 [Suillus luteus UH-Slu-Lm8-n1]
MSMRRRLLHEYASSLRRLLTQCHRLICQCTVFPTASQLPPHCVLHPSYGTSYNFDPQPLHVPTVTITQTGLGPSRRMGMMD